jgi:hypothetical protein
MHGMYWLGGAVTLLLFDYVVIAQVSAEDI